jgi:hypothetical protein
MHLGALPWMWSTFKRPATNDEKKKGAKIMTEDCRINAIFSGRKTSERLP